MTLKNTEDPPRISVTMEVPMDLSVALMVSHLDLVILLESLILLPQLAQVEAQECQLQNSPAQDICSDQDTEGQEVHLGVFVSL